MIQIMRKSVVTKLSKIGHAAMLAEVGIVYRSIWSDILPPGSDREMRKTHVA
jgi:hypothetical protein